MRLLKITTVLFVGLAMSLTACSEKRGFRSRVPVVEPSSVDLPPASESPEVEENSGSESTTEPGTETPDASLDAEQTEETSGESSELSGPAVMDEASDSSSEQENYGPVIPAEDGVRDAYEQATGVTPLAALTAEDQEFTARAAELFTAEILGQEVTPELIQQSLSQNFNPALSRNIIGMSVRRVVQAAPTDESAGLYDIAVDFGLRWTDAETGESNVDHMISTFQLQYPHMNGSGVVEAAVAFAQELDTDDGGRVENIVLYATCAAENCSELLILLRMKDPRTEQAGQENIAAYEFVDHMADPEFMLIRNTSVGIDNFKNFEEIQEQILQAAEAQEQEAVAEEEASAEDSVPAENDDGSQPVEDMGTEETVAGEGQTVELEEQAEQEDVEVAADSQTADEELSISDRVRRAGAERKAQAEAAAAEAAADADEEPAMRTDSRDRGNGIRTYKGGFIE